MTSEIDPQDTDTTPEDTTAPIHDDRLWRSDGWTALVIKNEDDDGWAVSMTRDGESEPALVGPWTMGRDKKNPKPLDAPAFSTLVKTASEVIRRHEQQLHAQLHKNLRTNSDRGVITVHFDIVPDEDQPYATLSALDEYSDALAQVKVAPDFRFNARSAQAWVDSGFEKPAS